MEQNVGRRISGLGLTENRVHLAWGGGLSSRALWQWWLLSRGWVFLWEFLRRHYWDGLLSVPGVPASRHSRVGFPSWAAGGRRDSRSSPHPWLLALLFHGPAPGVPPFCTHRIHSSPEQWSSMWLASPAVLTAEEPEAPSLLVFLPGCLCPVELIGLSLSVAIGSFLLDCGLAG